MDQLITVNPAVVLDVVLKQLESRGVLVDDYAEVFGALSFDEVVAEVVKLSITRPVTVA